jgi:polyadenylate-binding protein
MLLNNRKLCVTLLIPKEKRQRGAEKEKTFTNLFVKNLDAELNEEELKKLFEPFGTITSLVLSTDESGKSKGFGFVNFEKHEDAVKALEAMNQREVRGQLLFVSRAQKKLERKEELREAFEQLKLSQMSKYQGNNLFVKNLDESIDDERLRQEFSPFGSIVNAKVMRNDQGAHRGFGFVCFSSPEEATKAIEEMNGRMLNNKFLYVALAQTKLEREKYHRLHRQGMLPPTMVSNPLYATPHPPFMYPAAAGLPPNVRASHMVPQHVMIPSGFRSRFPPSATVGTNNVPGGRPTSTPPVHGFFPTSPTMSLGSSGNGNGSGGAAATAAGQRFPRSQRPPRMTGMMYPGIPLATLPPGVMMPPGVSMMSNVVPSMVPPPPRGVAYTDKVRIGGGSNPKELGHEVSSESVTDPHAVAAGVTPSAMNPMAAPTMFSAPKNQRQLLGEQLFPLVQALEPTYAGKITGMLLEMDYNDLLALLNSPELLDNRIREARRVLFDAMNSNRVSGEPLPLTEPKTTTTA